jgi:hypothetical protein
MKPTLDDIHKIYARFSRRHCGDRLGSTVQNYQSTVFRGSGGPAQKPEKRTSFRDISHSFSRREQFQHFVTELALFGIICLTAGASLYVGMTALVQFLVTR